MSTCGYPWCEHEVRITLDRGTVVRHRGTIARLARGPLTARITATVLGDDAPVLGIETSKNEDDTPGRQVLTMDAGTARKIATSVIDFIDMMRCDLDQPGRLSRNLHQRAEQERAEHGPCLRMGPFDDMPYGLADLVTEHFTTTTTTVERGTSWLLGILASRHIETGHADRDTTRDIVTDLGPDGTQVIGGWIFRAG